MTWLSELGTRLLGRAPRGHLAAFGKHPGWDDHLDDLGLDTEALLAVKQYLYIQGIGGAIDAGTWENKAEGEVLPEFKHIFVWMAGADVLVGRIWASRDGKNRTRYPMILCAHFENVDFDRVLPQIDTALARWEKECRATDSAETVRRIVKTGQQEIRQLLDFPLAKAFAEGDFLTRIQSASGPETLPRLAYALDAFLSPLGPGKVPRRELDLNSRLGETRVVPQHLRVPADAANPLAGLRFWHQILAGFIDDAVPVLSIVPLGQPWIDLIVGPATAQHLGCLRLAPPNLPLSSEVPFTIDEAARMRSEKLFHP